jgi:hypothetical protein
MAHAFVLSQPGWLMQGEITTSSGLSPTQLSNNNLKVNQLCHKRQKYLYRCQNWAGRLLVG